MQSRGSVGSMGSRRGIPPQASHRLGAGGRCAGSSPVRRPWTPAAERRRLTRGGGCRIPPYFALIIRAISVLEGIALTGDPDFAIVDEAYPYVAKRLLTDKHPRLQAALRYMARPARARARAAAVPPSRLGGRRSLPACILRF